MKQKASPPQGKAQKAALAGKFVDRNLLPVNPLKQQFAPTDAEPVSQHKRMAGAC